MNTEVIRIFQCNTIHSAVIGNSFSERMLALILERICILKKFCLIRNGHNVCNHGNATRDRSCLIENNYLRLAGLLERG